MVVQHLHTVRCESSTLSITTKFAALADVVIAPVWSTEEWGSIPQGGTKICERGGMVYTADLKSAALGIEGSSPSAHTIKKNIFKIISKKHWQTWTMTI